MRNLLTSICLLLALASPQIQAQQQSLDVILGRQKTIVVLEGSKITIGDPNIAVANVLPSKKEIVITGRNEGTTYLRIDPPSGNPVQEFAIRVLQQDLKMISVEVEVIEINRSHGTEFNDGRLPDNQLSVFGELGKKPTVTFSVDISVLDKLAYWKSNGTGKVIANPIMAVTSGDTARFLVGGEVPVAFAAGPGQIAIEYKEYGTRMKVVPRLTGSGKIMLDILAEVSSIDYAGPVDASGAPRFLTRRISSKGFVAAGETVAMAGLYQTLRSQSKRRVPILGHLLPWIFASVRDSEEITELIVLVTPRATVDIKIKDYPLIDEELQSAKE